MSTMLRGIPGNLLSLILSFLLAAALATPSTAQQMGRVEGTVVQAGNGEPVGGVRVDVVGTKIATLTGTDGSFVLQRVPAGQHTLLFRWLGFQAHQETVTVAAGTTQRLDVRLQPQAMSLGEVIVTTGPGTRERLVEAPAAIAVVDRITLRDQSITGQAPTALMHLPGVDVVQSGVNDFNVNARGFNSSLNRRILVLQDGRDLSIAFLGSQEWNGMSLPLEDIGRLEMVRGPGSALYGANAFSGVINITTPTARDVIGTKISLGGGELNTLRGDVRHAGVSTDGRIGYRFNLGYYRSDSYSRSRTAFDGRDVISEYNDVADVLLLPGTTAGAVSCAGVDDCLSTEARTLLGQTADPTTGVAAGDIDALQNIYGSGRFDYYADNGSLFSVEGGAAQVENELFVTGIGRVQVEKALKPWARASWAADDYNLMAWYTGRNSLEPQYSLSSGIPLEERSSIFHFEGQYNRAFAEDKARVVLGASFRNYQVDTEGTLMNMLNDDRNDNYYSAYGQFEYRPAPKVRLVLAARVDEIDIDGTSIATQFSPKGAIVVLPHPDHAIRLSVNRAFQTPNYSEFFLQVPAGRPTADPGALEAGLEGYFATLTDPTQVGPGLAGIFQAMNLPTDLSWDFSPETPVLALGNENLDVETVTGWELGYKGTVADNVYVSVDLYFNRLSNFVTDLLPGVNPAQYPFFDITGDDVGATLAAIDATLAGLGLPANHPLRVPLLTELQPGYAALLASAVGTPALVTLPDGSRAIVVSYANAGRVDEVGVEIGVGYGFTPELRGDASYTYFGFDIKDAGLEQLVPNTTRHKSNISLTYTSVQGFDASVKARFLEGYDWAAGVFQGKIPSSQTINLTAGYRINNFVRFYGMVTNLLDQQRFQLYGGSVIGRRILTGMTATF